MSKSALIQALASSREVTRDSVLEVSKDPAAITELRRALFRKAPHKLTWFKGVGYTPHLYQLFFHTFTGPNGLTCVERHLAAGRRSGKTKSCANELAYYCLHPEQFHLETKGIKSSRPLNTWALSPVGSSMGRVPRRELVESPEAVLVKAGLKEGRDYKYNRNAGSIKFANGSMIEFRSARDPGALVGEGLDAIWIDESAVIPTRDAWDFSQAALDDREGVLMTSTTPRGKNWHWEEFWSGPALEDEQNARLKFWSLDNPHFPASRWQRRLKRMHPAVFRQEMMAEFETVGVTLLEQWLSYYEQDELPRTPAKALALDLYLGVDPAISERSTGDNFAITLIGVDTTTGRTYVLRNEAYSPSELPFPDQVELIGKWWERYRPRQIGIESVAYQAALAQQVRRLPGFPPVKEIRTTINKQARLAALGPMAHQGLLLFPRDSDELIGEWVSFDGAKRDNRDDRLDSLEIALQAAGLLLPTDFTDQGYTDREGNWVEWEDDNEDPAFTGHFDERGDFHVQIRAMSKGPAGHNEVLGDFI